MSQNKPKLLLHTCCGVCGSWVPESLLTDFEVDLFFFNPNIQPEEEYARRRDAARQVADSLNLKFIEKNYKPEKWLLSVRGHEGDPEGGERCKICFDFRLKEVAKYAKENGYDYFATTLTVGRNKKADVINPLGEKWANHFGIKFLARDFKKSGGQEKTDKESRRLHLYRQNYCGCIFSIKKV